MKKLIIVLPLLFFFSSIFAQKDIKAMVKGDHGVSKHFQTFEKNQQVPFNPSNARNTFGFDAGSDLVLLNNETDKLGMTHYRYTQTYKGIPVENTMYIAHTKDGKLTAVNGAVITEFDAGIQNLAVASVSPEQAVEDALSYVHAVKYAWQDAGFEQRIKLRAGKNATYYPGALKVWYSGDNDISPHDLRLAYKVDVYSLKPLDRKFIYIDARSGQILGSKQEMMHADVSGTAATGYSGSQNIHSDLKGDSTYLLRDLTKGSGVITLHADSAHTDYVNNSANWALTGLDKWALDVHYGVAATWTYYKNIFNRNSVDNKGYALRSWVNDSAQRNNASWDGSEMDFGNITSTGNGLVAIDVTGHELTHGVTQYTSGLVYSKESGAINESMSDIMGKAVQFYSKPADNSWLIGNDMNYFLRDMSNPNAFGQPDTYKGTHWINTTSCIPAGGNDFCGVHTNSGVGNFMFYLLVTGGSGTNDLGDKYGVTGIGLAKAQQILYRAGVNYLTSTSQYIDWRQACISAATDLYGASSGEVAQVKNAWYAVGVGVEHVDIEFVIDDTGSMSEEIEGVKNSILQILSLPLFTTGTTSYRFQLTTFKDDISTRASTTDLNVIKNQVSALFASGGNDCPEASVEAVDAIKDSVKKGGIIFLATDASPHAGLNITDLAAALKTRGVSLSVLLSGDCTGSFLVPSSSPSAGNRSNTDTIPYSDNHDNSTVNKPAIGASTNLSPNPTAIEAFSYLAGETGGLFSFVPEVNTGNPNDKTRYINIAYNLILGALAPSITSVEPGSAPRGGTLAFTISGLKTNFNATTTLSFGDTGIVVKEIKVLSPSKLQATVTIGSLVPLGFKDIKSHTDLGGGNADTAGGKGLLQITAAPTTPTIISISPTSGAQGETLSVKVTGINTHFTNASVLTVGSGITVLNTIALSSVELQANIQIAATAAIGFRDVRVVTGSETATENVTGPFLVTAPYTGPVDSTICDFSSWSAGPDKTVNLFYADSSCTTLSVSVPPGSYSFKWSTGDTTRAITVCPTAKTSYFVTVINGSCTFRDTVNVDVVRCPGNIIVTAPSCTEKTAISWIEPRDTFPASFSAPVLLDPSAGSFTYLGSYGGHGYYKSNNNYLWPVARDVAKLVGGTGVSGHLVSITSAEENSFVTGRIRGGGVAPWIGLFNTGKPGRFRWVGGEDLTYTNWSPGEPNNYGGNDNNIAEPYVRLYEDGTWNDEHSVSLPFITEFEKPLIKYRQLSGPKNGSMQKTGVYVICYERTNTITDQKDTCCFTVTITCSPSLTAENTASPGSKTMESNASDNTVGAGLRARVRPNPSSTYFMIDLTADRTEKISLQVYDVLGRVVERRDGLASSQTIQIGNSFKPGIYYLQITQGVKKITMKMIKQSK